MSSPAVESLRPLKVLFLTRYPVDGASSRYRVYQYLPHFEALGVQCRVQSFMSQAMYQLSFSKGRSLRKMWETGKAVLRRLVVLAGYGRYDIIYMQRELLPFGPPVIERFLRWRGATLVFDYDDALFIHKPSRYNPLASLLRSPDKVRQLFGIVHCVIAGNDWLRDEARKSGAQAETVEVAEDTVRIQPHGPHTNDVPVTLGWLGSSSTVKYLRLIEPVLVELAARNPQLRFEIMGGGEFSMPGVPWTLTPWSLDGELEALRRFDIGIMPLPDEQWANGKSGGKARTYMAAGVVPVCAAVGYNLELIDHGRTGFLCASHDDWLQTLHRLVGDASLRDRVGRAAREEVTRRFSPLVQAARLRAIFDTLVARARP
ncbi:glycosyltransferase family 4 protein [Arenimonas sp. MALMAid1274]|uniref:glycosyltransferase family 4 protein n=1 Tax=Arenimonas sp. MALMAid1274 TaxID=3411630 RepID=UPI003BA1B223